MLYFEIVKENGSARLIDAYETFEEMQEHFLHEALFVGKAQAGGQVIGAEHWFYETYTTPKEENLFKKMKEMEFDVDFSFNFGNEQKQKETDLEKMSKDELLDYFHQKCFDDFNANKASVKYIAR